MNTILEFVKHYMILMLVMFLFSYLAPKESYRKYFHFFISVLMVAVLLQPVLTFFAGDTRQEAEEELKQIQKKLDSIEYYEKGESILEQYLGETEEPE